MVGAPLAFRRSCWQSAGTLLPLFGGEGWRAWSWLPVAILVGALPVALSAPFGTNLHQPITALLLFALFLSALRSERVGACVAVVGVVYAAHSAVAIGLSAAYPELMDPCLPGGADYWALQERWIRTGVNDEYLVSNWLPFHLQLLVAVVILGYLSLGMIVFYQGFYEVDLMNYYVGQLLAHSESAPVALALGWHPWSLTRGIGYSLLALVVAQASLSRLSGVRLGTPRQKRWLWGLGLGFFALDCLLKLTVLDGVRAGLAANLR